MQRFQQTGRALGSDIALTLMANDLAAATALFNSLWAQVGDFEARFSRFQTDSELTQLNARAGVATPISVPMAALLQTCQYLTKRTNGLFNPLILPELQRAGYVGSWPAPQQVNPALDYRGRNGGVVAGRDFQLDSGGGQPATDRGQAVSGGGQAATVTLPADSALDFGGIGKGYLLD